MNSAPASHGVEFLNVTAASQIAHPGRAHFQHPGTVTSPAQSRIVLSLFPGAGLLDRGFERAGFCVLRGPDTVFGQRIEDLIADALAGHLAGIIGGPPCQDFSRARRRPPTGHGLRMLKEFARIVMAAQPDWYLIENVPGVPTVIIPGYRVQRFNVRACEFGGKQRRNRSYQFGTKDGVPLVLKRTESQFRKLAPAVLSNDCRNGRRTFADRCELMGLPRNFDLPGLSRTAKFRAVGNGVPVYVAQAVAEAIRDRGVTANGVRLCPCNCGRVLEGRQERATVACRKRLSRAARGITPRTVAVV